MSETTEGSWTIPNGNRRKDQSSPEGTACERFEVSAQGTGQIPADLLGHARYLVIERIGSGAMGEVYRAVHLLMDRVVALKVIHPNLVGSSGASGRFLREVRAAARLSHANIVAAFDADRAGGTHFLVMEFVEGINLDDWLKVKGSLSVAEAAGYAHQVAWGLQHAHEKGMVHRDIKPHNLMLTPDGRVKILDFGLAQFVSEATAAPIAPDTSPFQEGATTLAIPADGEGAVSVAGTPDYMAPEEFDDPRRADIRADIYSLGCTLYRFLVGQVPFPGGGLNDKMRRHREEPPVSLLSLRPQVPARLAEVVARMMAKKPEDRYQTPAEVARALAPFTAAVLPRVLVVDDDPSVRVALSMMLEAKGYDVIQAADGVEALELLREEPKPGLILLDLAMPRMDGWTFLRERQGDAALSRIPVVLVSATDIGEACATALGTAGQIHKPVAPQEVAERIGHLGMPWSVRSDRPSILEALRLPELLRAICLRAGMSLEQASASQERFIIRTGAEPPEFFATLLEEVLGEEGGQVALWTESGTPDYGTLPGGHIAIQPGFAGPCPNADELKRALGKGRKRVLMFAVERRNAQGNILGVTWAALPECEPAPEANFKAAVLNLDASDFQEIGP